MKAFALAEKRTSPGPMPRRTMAASPADPDWHTGRAAVRQILRGPRLQAKLTIGAPDDIYEQEADRVADEVMRMPEPQLPTVPACNVGACSRVEEETLQAKPLTDQITPLVQRQVEEEEEEELLQTKALDDTPNLALQHQPEEEEEELLQTKQAAGHTPEVTPRVASAITSLHGSGQPLSPSERAFFEPRFGQDFSMVRIHTESQATEAARAVNAKAFTVRRDIVFGAGQFALSSREGKRLLAHELTHVVQQGGGGAGSPAGLLTPALLQLQRQEVDVEQRLAQVRDYNDALDYLRSFYRNVQLFIDAQREAETSAIHNFTQYTQIPDPPDLAKEFIIGLMSAAFSLIGGWDLITKGLTRGVFAVNLMRMERELVEQLGIEAVEQVRRLGPEQRDTELGTLLSQLAEQGTGLHSSTSAKSDLSASATQSGRTGRQSAQAHTQSVVEWGLHTAAALREEEIAFSWLKGSRDDPDLQGRLTAEITASLGPLPEIEAAARQIGQAVDNIELELYKERFGGSSGATLTVNKGRVWVYSREIRGGGWVRAVGERIIELNDWERGDLERVAQWLQIPRRESRVMEQGRML
jgi:hypothetical protein